MLVGPDQPLGRSGLPKNLMKISTSILVCLTILITGCNNSTPEVTPETIRADNPAKAEVTDKLQNMTPEERAAYIQANQGEIQNTYSGANNPDPSAR